MRSNVLTWNQVAAYLHTQPAHSCMNILKWQVEHPTAAGLRPSLGLPVGQMGDWRYSSGHGLHVREYFDRYTVHVDSVNPNCDLPGHIVSDAPMIAAGVALGALIGLALGENAGAMMVGALIGGALGVAAASAAEESKCAAPKPRGA